MQNWTYSTRPSALLVKVLLLLAVAECSVRVIFFNFYIVPHFMRGYPLLRERSGGGNLTIFFDLMRRSEPHRTRIAFLGDSVMKALPGADDTIVPFLVREKLRRRFRGLQIEAVDASVIGLYASDGLLMAAKLLGADANVIVYGVLPRALPRRPDAIWTTRVSSELGPTDLSRLLLVGGGGWLARNFDAEQLIAGVVRSGWKTYAYRTLIRRCLGDTLARRWPAMAVLNAPLPAAPQVAQPFNPATFRQIDWTYDEYGPPSKNWEALEFLGRLCARYAPRRCLIFSSPINPERRNDILDPALYQQYLATLRDLADRYGLVFRDYTDGLTPSDFVPPQYGRPDPMHLSVSGRAKLAAQLADPIAAIIAAEVVGRPTTSEAGVDMGKDQRERGAGG